MAIIKRGICALIAASCVLSCIWQAAAAEKAENIIYVSTSGRAGGDGSVLKPVSNLQDAITLVSKKYKSENEVTIEIEGGNYSVSKGIQITRDTLSGFNGKLNIRNKEGQEVNISGSRVLNVNDFKPVTDEKIRARLYADAADKIGVLDLAKYGYTRENVDFLYGVKAYHGSRNLLSLRLNGNEETIARYPNVGTVTIKNIVRREDRNSFPTTVYDKSRHDDVNVGDGTTAVIEFNYPQIQRWEQAQDAFVKGYIWVDYEADTVKVRKFDAENKTIEFGNKTIYGVRENRQIYITNLLEEIDVPGEYYVDPREVKLYYYPSHKLKSEDLLEILSLKEPLLNLSEVNNINFSGICFKNTDDIGVKINKCNNVNFDKCTISNTKEYGIHALSYTNSTIKNCDLYNIGNAGIYIEESGDKLTLTSGNVIIHNNHLWHVSTGVTGGWNGGIRLGAKCIGAKVTNNLIHDSIANPLTYEGNDNYMGYNEIYNTLRRTADAGTIYTGRNFTLYGNYVEYNYLHDNTNPNASNYGSLGSYIDDWCTGQNFKNNIVHMGKKKHTTAMGTHSKHTTIQYNIAYEAEIGLQLGDRSGSVPNVLDISGFASYTLTNGGNIGLDPDFWSKGIWKERFPQIGEIMPQINRDNGYFLREGNVLTDNVCVDAPVVITNPDTAYLYNTIERNLDVNDTSIFVDVNNHDFRLTMDAVKKYNLSEKIINEENFSMDEIGIQTDERDLNASNSEFGLVYPADAATKIQKEGLLLKWEPALFADEYIYTLATDKELKNVIKTGTVYDTQVTIDGLENGITYYWTVKAKQIGKQLNGEWNTKDGIFSFKVAKYDKLYKDELKETLEEFKELIPTITEGSEVGEYKNGTVDKLEKETAYAEKLISDTYGLQNDIEACVTRIRNVIDGIGGYKHLGYQTLDIKDENAFYAIKKEETAVVFENGIWSGCATDVSMGNIVYTGQIENYKVLKFKMKIDKPTEGGWAGITLRQIRPDYSSYSTASSSYLMVIKENLFELQKYNPGAPKTGVLKTYPNNGEFKFGEWNDITFGAVDVESGVEILLKIGDKVIFDWLDTEVPNFEPGSFVITPPGKGATVSVAPCDNLPTGEYIPDSSLFEENSGKAETVYTVKDSIYNEKGTWTDFMAQGYGSDHVRISTGGEAVWEKTVSNDIIDVYYWHTPLADGDKNAKVVFYTLNPQGTQREHEIRVNFAAGTAGWQKIGSFKPLSFHATEGLLGVKIAGSGKGIIPASAIKSVIADMASEDFSKAFFNNGKNVMAMQIGSGKVFIHSAEQTVEQPPVIENDRTLVPIRVIAEYYGFDVDWNEQTREVTLKNSENTVKLTIDSNSYSVNGEEKQLDSPAVIRNGRTILPIRAVAEGMGKQVSWDNEKKIILIGDELSVDSKTDLEKREIFDLIGQGFER